ncbi:MAG TPA: MipA/OmpV family protein [Burkholderiales bacterium]
MRARLRRAASAAVLACAAGGAAASSDPFVDWLAPGGAAVGLVTRLERSAYRGADSAADSMPLYLYEGEHAYLHGTSAGLKLRRGAWRIDAFLRYRLEGFTQDRRPDGSEALEPRLPGLDAGLALRRRTPWGTPYVELLRDASRHSNGSELRLGYWNEWRRGRLTLRPNALLAWRSESLNDYYYGVPGEYAAGAGVDLQLALYASYALDESWQLLGALRAARRSREVTASPLARGGLQGDAFVGILYDFSPKQARWRPPAQPLIVKVLYGYSSDCDVLQIVRLSCTTTHTVDDTDIAALHVGRKLIEGAGGWPVDLAGFVGVQRQLEKGEQDDFFSVMAFFKAYYYGFPWDRVLRTRIGLGAGLSYSERVMTMEERDQGRRGRGTWKLLNYLDPSIDFRVARDTWLGIGVSHRSGAFGKSLLFGNVNGGSNFIYVSLETAF